MEAESQNLRFVGSSCERRSNQTGRLPAWFLMPGGLYRCFSLHFGGNAARLCALNRETLKAVFETAMCILPDAETLRGQGYPAFAVEKGSLICTRHTLID